MQHPAPPRSKATSGFSLLEVMVSLTVLSLVVVASLQVQVTSSNLMRDARGTNEAALALHTALSRVLLADPSDIMDGSGPYVLDAPTPLQGGPRDATVLLSSPGLSTGDPVPDVLDLHLTLTWTSETGQPRDLTFVGAIR